MKASRVLTLCTAPTLAMALSFTGESRGPELAWCDFTGDGLLDLAAVQPAGRLQLFKNLGGGAMEDATQAAGLDVPHARAVSWQDVDGDLTPDLFVLTPSGETALYRGIGPGRFEDATAATGLDQAPRAWKAQWADRDLDGHIDLELWTESGVRLLHNDGMGFLELAPFEIASERNAEAGGIVVSDQATAEKADGGGAGNRDRAAAPDRDGKSRPDGAREREKDGRKGATSGGSRRLGGGAVNGSASEYCPAGISDSSAPGSCLNASSVPTQGMLYPLSSDLFVDPSGSVGIGTNNPRSQLHLRGEALEAEMRLSPGTSNGSSRLLLLENNATNDFGAKLAYDGGLDELHIGTLSGATENVRIAIERISGEVGINTTDPLADLHIMGGPNVGSLMITPASASTGNASQIVLGEDDEATYGMKLRFDGAENLLRIKGIVDGTETTHVTVGRSDGRVGIGTADPSGHLEVVTDRTGVTNATVRSFNTSTGPGNAFYAETAGTGTTAIIKQLGTGAIIKGDNTSGTVFTVSNTGRVVTTAVQITGGGDLVEGFESQVALEPGTVVAIDPGSEGSLVPTSGSYDRKVAGVVSGAGGVSHGIRMGQDGVLDGENLVAMAGRVYVLCTSENGPIIAGDLLTSASREGHAMRATDAERSFGAVIGKALSSMDAESGMVLVLVNLQ
jgi:hypothetical protein